MIHNIESIERRLWNSADTLRANSNFASNEYFLPVMGLIFLRHAYNRFLMVRKAIEPTLPKRGGKTRPLMKEDFSQRGAIFLRPKAQFDYLVSLTDSDDRAKAIIEAMESIEADYDSLKGVLPKNEYQTLDNEVLGHLLRNFDPDELKTATGDVFGRIYEYFLTQFAGLKAHDDGEFFTPVSLVSLIANVLEPSQGIVLDPACGSGGMFVQSARFVTNQYKNPTDYLTFYGLEKNPTTIRLAKMNLAVHGLEGDIKMAITYYEDPHELLGKASYVMANPPFNVDEIDAEKVKKDPRLPFGLPGVNKKGKVSNGNYIWISYFYSYLNEKGRAGFVMSSQASGAGNDETLVRKKLIETGDVDIMIAIRSNFFYTRTVPCELWFLNRNKPEEYKNKVLMIDARNIFRKVTRKINDFSPEQENNILAIVWLYRQETKLFLDLGCSYCQRVLVEADNCFKNKDETGSGIFPLPDFILSVNNVLMIIRPLLDSIDDKTAMEDLSEVDKAISLFRNDVESFRKNTSDRQTEWKKQEFNNEGLKKGIDNLGTLAETSRNLVKQIEMIYKMLSRLIESCDKGCTASEDYKKTKRKLYKERKICDERHRSSVEQLKQVRYYWKNAHWLTDRFPQAKLQDVEGLVKLVDISEIEANNWSLTPGRYVGVAPEEIDENFDFEETLRDIHLELEDLNQEAIKLAALIKKNFQELGI